MTSETSVKIEPGNQDLMDRILQSTDEIPPMPQVVIKAQELAADLNSSPKEVAALLETDQAIATQVLKMANSAFYGLSGKIDTIQHAALVLGYRTLGEIIGMVGTKQYLEKNYRDMDLSPRTYGDIHYQWESVQKLLPEREIPTLNMWRIRQVSFMISASSSLTNMSWK